MTDGWIAVDLDGCLAVDDWDPDKPFDPSYIGPPVPLMVARVKQWLAEGVTVKIFTARVSGPIEGREGPDGWMDVYAIIRIITDWCVEHIGQPLSITCVKDYQMKQLWDDRAIQVVRNTGERVGSVER